MTKLSEAIDSLKTFTFEQQENAGLFELEGGGFELLTQREAISGDLPQVAMDPGGRVFLHRWPPERDVDIERWRCAVCTRELGEDRVAAALAGNNWTFTCSDECEEESNAK